MRSALGCGSSTVASVLAAGTTATVGEGAGIAAGAAARTADCAAGLSGFERSGTAAMLSDLPPASQWPVYPMTTATTNTAPATIGHRAARGGATSAVSIAASLRTCAASASLAARRAASGTGCPALSSRGTAAVRPVAPAAASRGWVIVASKARLRAALQSRHNFAPGRLSRPQMRHFMAFRAHFSVLAVPEIGHGASRQTRGPNDMITA